MREKEFIRHNKTNKMFIACYSQSVFLTVINLNLNELNSPIERHRLAICKRCILDLKPLIGWKWENGKRFSVKMVTQASSHGYANNRQINIH